MKDKFIKLITAPLISENTKSLAQEDLKTKTRLAYTLAFVFLFPINMPIDPSLCMNQII